MAKEMTLRQRKFCHAYLLNDGNGVSAVVEAGYNPKPGCEKQLAYNILKSVAVQKCINRAIDRMEKDFGITFGYKLLKLKRVVDFCIPDNEDLPVVDGAVGVKAICEMNKMQGDYAPVKNENTNANINSDVDIQDMQALIKQHEKDY